jgi:hypothetical protein
METNTWPQLAEGLYGFLTGREATLEYTVDRMEIWVPRDTTRDAPQARWQVNGTVGGARAHLLARGNLVELDLEQPRRFVSAAGFGGGAPCDCWRFNSIAWRSRCGSRAVGPLLSPSAAKRGPVWSGGSSVPHIWKSATGCPSGVCCDSVGHHMFVLILTRLSAVVDVVGSVGGRR